MPANTKQQKISIWVVLTLVSSLAVSWTLVLTDRFISVIVAEKIIERYEGSVYFYGDANGDGGLGLDDADLIMRRFKNEKVALNLVNADFNEDRVIDQKDARAVLIILYQVQDVCGDVTIDYNYDGTCDGDDINLFISQY